jgi:hypothetical protein
VTAGKGVAADELADNVVPAALREKAQTLGDCLVQEHDFTGLADLQLSLDVDGQVAAYATGINDAVAADCLSATASALKLPRPAGETKLVCPLLAPDGVYRLGKQVEAGVHVVRLTPGEMLLDGHKETTETIRDALSDLGLGTGTRLILAPDPDTEGDLVTAAIGAAQNASLLVQFSVRREGGWRLLPGLADDTGVPDNALVVTVGAQVDVGEAHLAADASVIAGALRKADPKGEPIVVSLDADLSTTGLIALIDAIRIAGISRYKISSD